MFPGNGGLKMLKFFFWFFFVQKLKRGGLVVVLMDGVFLFVLLLNFISLLQSSVRYLSLE